MPVDKDEFVIPRLSTLQPIEGQLGRGFPTFIDPEYVSDWETMNIKPVLSHDADMEWEGTCRLDPEKIRKLLDKLDEDPRYNVDIKPMSMRFTCNSPAMVPVRKHRKKRIAKKWAKKYGYKYEFRKVRLDEVSLELDNDLDILGKEFVVR